MVVEIFARFGRLGRPLVYGALLAVLPLACVGPGGRHGAQEVAVLTPDEVLGCTDRGSVHVSVMDRLAQLEREEGAVAGELGRLARNSALQLGGNALVPLTDIVDGSRSFAVFECP
jgi:hypothetical protein